MPVKLDFTNFRDPDLSEAFVEHLVRETAPGRAMHFQRLWSYYRNDLTPLGEGVPDADSNADWSAGAKPYYQAQEFGLPARITGRSHLGFGGAGVPLPDIRRKEVVVENDIGWRVDTAVHFLAGKPVGIESLARRTEDARRIEAALASVWDASGRLALWQEMALLGAVYGFVDLVIRVRPDSGDAAKAGGYRGGGDGGASDPAPALHAGLSLAVDAVEAPCILPVLDETDARRLRYWIQTYRRQTNRVADAGLFSRLLGRAARLEEVDVLEIFGPTWWQQYEDGVLVAEGENLLGRVPVVHIQNFAQPARYEGASEVEPLIPLQDELNTRLSDRANRVTFQSFKMYLGKGIDGFEDRTIAPGRMWATENPDASIEEFGGDTESPGETAHIAELREAMDKTSGVTPLAAGLLRDSLGNLTSATALRVVLAGTLARLERKRVTYGAGIIEANRIILEALDRLGILATDPLDRQTRLHWPTPLPENLSEKLAEAKAKRDLGVPVETVLRELGYEPSATK
jgi:hypothetical protein